MSKQLTRKQYYSRMSGLVKSGTIKERMEDMDYIAIGKVIYNIQTTKKVFSEYYATFIVRILVIKEYNIMEKLYYLTYY
ncbi:MAG TPA: hypothetical protein VFD60_01010 [Nitrososphaeraceae archaeon]|nr:hypothetical protein [Nitrososphaeraceae archaeon]